MGVVGKVVEGRVLLDVDRVFRTDVIAGGVETVLKPIEQVDLACTAGLGDGGGQEADGTAAEDRHRLAWLDAAELDRVVGDPERLEHRTFVEGQSIGQVFELALLDNQKLRECPLHARAGEETHVRTPVLVPGEAVLAHPAREPGLDSHPVTFAEPGPGVGADNHPGALVAQGLGVLAGLAPYPALIVIVDIGTAHPDRACGDEKLLPRGLRIGLVDYP
jgi:hypothetical protein